MVVSLWKRKQRIRFLSWVGSAVFAGQLGHRPRGCVLAHIGSLYSIRSAGKQQLWRSKGVGVETSLGVDNDGLRSEPNGVRLPELNFAGPLSEGLQRVLGQAIISGDLAPGSKINVGALARQLGVSAIPVREALHGLEAQGWVFFKPRYGAYVRERSRAEAVDLHEARQILEPEIAALAAQRRNAESLEMLAKLVEEGDKAADGGHTAGFAALNSAFHRTMASAAHNVVLAELNDQLALRTQFYFAAAVSQRFVESAREHRQIYLAVETGNGPLAAKLAREHAAATSVALQSTFSQDGPHGIPTI